MKALITFGVASLTVLVVLSTVAAVQTAGLQDSDITRREIRMKYDAGSVDGVRLTVYLMEGDRAIAVDPGRSFKKGDQIKIEFESSFDGYVYFINVAPSGRSAVIYPDLKGPEADNRIRQRQRYVLPRATAFEFVNDEKGIEVIQVVMARQPVSLFEDAIKNSRGELGTTASTAAAELMGLESKRAGIDSRTTSNILPASTRSRVIRLAPPKDKEDKGTVIAVPDSKLRPGEVAVFEIRLRHT